MSTKERVERKRAVMRLRKSAKRWDCLMLYLKIIGLIAFMSINLS